MLHVKYCAYNFIRLYLPNQFDLILMVRIYLQFHWVNLINNINRSDNYKINYVELDFKHF